MLPFVLLILAAVASESARSALVKDLKTVPTPKAIDSDLVTKIETPSDEGLEPMVPTAQVEFYPVGTPKIVTLKPRNVKPKPVAAKPVKANDFTPQEPTLNSENTDEQVDFQPYQEADLAVDEYTAEDEQPQPQETPFQTAKSVHTSPSAQVTMVRSSALLRNSANQPEGAAAQPAPASQIPVPEGEETHKRTESTSPQTAQTAGY